MLTHKTILTVVITALLATSSVYAEHNSVKDKGTNFGGPDAVDNQIAEDNKKSKPDFKTQLEQNNINMGVDYSTVFLRANNVLPGSDDNASSGMVRFYGSWNPVGVGTKETGGLVWKVEHRHSYTDTSVKDFEFGTGGLGLVTPPFSDQGFRVTNLYYKQKLMDGKATVVAGFLDITDFVDVFAMASPWTGFMNFAFSTGTTTIALPGDAALGAAGGIMLTDEYYMVASLVDMNSDPTNILDGIDTFFSDNNYFKSVELGWTKSQGQIYVDNIHATLWHADESIEQGSTKGYGVNFSASRLIDGQWLPFVRAGYSQDAGTLMEKSISAGFGYYGLGGEANNLGVAMNWGQVAGSDDQYTTEVFYIMKPLDYLEVTADIQYIANPALNAIDSSTLIYGLRMRVAI
ncbi:carbohydrate porin [Colwellia psychrerythraea]|uniref:Carbohydrate-selective porin OprB n=1 Tax=Colwellia psychrerythraea TaxID=28229 RepID=A0A099L690_COLPS|nr:carbohydrate porin [Colwellia psychrerythraea]KGJ97413.1 Carbohydrate-selective porin OprB [Colwellia psychrerythraea]